MRTRSVFVAAYLSAYWVARTAVPDAAWDGYRQGVAAFGGGLLRTAGIEARVAGCVIAGGDSVTTVSPECIPYSALALGVALVASDGRLRVRTRIVGSMAVALAILAFNAGRVAVVAGLASTGSPLLEAVHLHILPVVLAGVAIAGWWLLARVGSRE